MAVVFDVLKMAPWDRHGTGALFWCEMPSLVTWVENRLTHIIYSVIWAISAHSVIRSGEGRVWISSVSDLGKSASD